MDLKKQRWFLLINFLLLFFISCNNRNEIKNKRLECLIDIFIDDSKINHNEYIYISETQNWTDSTSVIAFQYSNIYPSIIADSIETKISKYKNFKIIHNSSSFDGKIKRENLICNNLQWEMVNIENSKSIAEDVILNYSEYELQVIYDFKNRLIIDVLNVYPLYKKDVLNAINNCNL